MNRYLPCLIPLLYACGLLTFDVEQDAATQVDGAGILGELLGTLSLTGLDDFEVSIVQELEDQDVAPGDLVSVRLSEFTLSGDPDLAFLQTFEVYLSAEGLPEVRIAEALSFPADATPVALGIDDVNLADYVAAGGMAFRIAADGSAPEEDTHIEAHLVAAVEASVQGACNQ